MKSRYWLLVFGAIVISPIILYVLISQPWGFDAIGGEEAPKVWLGFWGGYIGAIISAAVAFIILNKQLNQNHTENEDNRALQLRVLEHSNAQQRLNELKSRLADFQIAFNILAITPIIENVINDKFFAEDTDKLILLTRDIDEKSFWIDVVSDKLEHSTELNQFNTIYNEIYNEYGILIADILFFIELMRHLPTNMEHIDPYIRFHLDNDKDARNEKREMLEARGIVLSENIAEIIERLGHYEDIRQNVQEIVSSRCAKPINNVSQLKENLKIAILNIINVEQQRIDRILQ